MWMYSGGRCQEMHAICGPAIGTDDTVHTWTRLLCVHPTKIRTAVDRALPCSAVGNERRVSMHLCSVHSPVQSVPCALTCAVCTVHTCVGVQRL